MVVPERFSRYGSSRLRDRFLSRTAKATLAIFLASWQIASVEGAAAPATKEVPFSERIDVQDAPHPSSRPDSLDFCAWSQQYMKSGVVFAGLPADPGTPLTVSGWFHIIWNGMPRYMLVDDGGEWVDLLIDEQVLRDAGGPLGLNRKRVRLTGRRSEKTPGAIQVIAINPEDERDEQ
jgi:hypothetical protein